MTLIKQILIAGDSLYLAALASELGRLPGVVVVMAGEVADPLALASPPDVILVESQGDLAAALALTRAYPLTPVLACDGQNHTVTTFAGRQTRLETLPDLVTTIEHSRY